MNLPERSTFPARPAWPDSDQYARGALGIAGRYFRACSMSPDAEIRDGLTSPPILHYPSLHGILTAAGIMIACDRHKPFAVVCPWGQWLFTASGGEARDVEFLGNTTFTHGLTLGKPWSPEGNERVELIPVLKIGAAKFPKPQLYRYTGLHDADGHAARIAEWRKMIFGINYAPPGVVESPGLRSERRHFAAATR